MEATRMSLRYEVSFEVKPWTSALTLTYPSYVSFSWTEKVGRKMNGKNEWGLIFIPAGKFSHLIFHHTYQGSFEGRNMQQCFVSPCKIKALKREFEELRQVCSSLASGSQTQIKFMMVKVCALVKCSDWRSWLPLGPARRACRASSCLW